LRQSASRYLARVEAGEEFGKRSLSDALREMRDER